jgi:translation elongation factor EF-Tu-like GTPase
MTRERDFGVTLVVDIRLLSTAEGGRRESIADGYRPLCLIDSPSGEDLVIGLCELELATDIRPGDTGTGRLKFDREVAEQVTSVLPVGSEFRLAEGQEPIGSAVVKSVV